MQSNPTNLPDSADAISATYLKSLLKRNFSERGELAGFTVQRLDRGSLHTNYS
jgi:hypothetical protein